ncbi:MAG: class I SAM-dependent methyltransferase, partial [Candidatus Brocadiales bacterium]|nr:class I SAM-dependent methyltransferase [Candidatus Bathyanammoxibius sp.]
MQRDDTVNITEYAERFKQPTDAYFYDYDIYKPDGYDAFIWDIQRPVLVALFRKLRSENDRIAYLDFACGTGRILAAVESLADESLGVDISEEMIAIARSKTKGSEFLVGNLLAQPDLLSCCFDVITTFRFFLNLESHLRLPALKTLVRHLRGPESTLIFNIHGNRNSARHLGILLRRLRGERHNDMTFHQVEELVNQAGLRIENYYGFGIIPRRLHCGFWRGWMQA